MCGFGAVVLLVELVFYSLSFLSFQHVVDSDLMGAVAGLCPCAAGFLPCRALIFLLENKSKLLVCAWLLCVCCSSLLVVMLFGAL